MVNKPLIRPYFWAWGLAFKDFKQLGCGVFRQSPAWSHYLVPVRRVKLMQAETLTKQKEVNDKKHVKTWKWCEHDVYCLHIYLQLYTHFFHYILFILYIYNLIGTWKSPHISSKLWKIHCLRTFTEDLFCRFLVGPGAWNSGMKNPVGSMYMVFFTYMTWLILMGQKRK